jgi:hypothetical protein
MDNFDLKKYLTEGRLLKEVGEGTSQPYNWKEISSDEFMTYVRFVTDTETEYMVELEYFKSNFEFAKDLPGFSLGFEAKIKGEYEFSKSVIVNRGEVYRVMATITNIINHYLEDNKIITYTPEKKTGEEFGTKRDSLYKAFITKKIPNVEFKQIGEMIVAILPHN